MSSATITFRENRLGKLLNQFGGVSVGKAIEAAEANLESIREANVAEVDRNLALLAETAARAKAEPDELAHRRAIYACANTVAGLAGACGLAEVGEAAFSLCELTDRLIATGRWNDEAIAVHLHAVSLLRAEATPETAELRRSILDGLADVVERAPAGPRGGTPRPPAP